MSNIMSETALIRPNVFTSSYLFKHLYLKYKFITILKRCNCDANDSNHFLVGEITADSQILIFGDFDDKTEQKVNLLSVPCWNEQRNKLK